MALSSLVPASRHLSVALRSRIPRHVARFHQSKQPLLADKSAFAEALRNFAPESAGAIKQKLKSAAKPVSDVTAAYVLRKEVPLVIFSVSALAYYAWSEQSKKNQNTAEDVPAPMLQGTSFFTPSLIHNEAMPLGSKSKLGENGPCEPCGLQANEADDSRDMSGVEETHQGGMKPMITPIPCVGGNSKEKTTSGIAIPEIVSHTNATEEKSPDAESRETSETSEIPETPEPTIGKRRRRKSRAVLQESNEE